MSGDESGTSLLPEHRGEPLEANAIERVVEYEATPDPDAVFSEPLAGETTIHRFRLSGELTTLFPGETRRTAEFWLNAADGDMGLALLLASERPNLAAATASQGFLRGRKLNTARGL